MASPLVAHVALVGLMGAGKSDVGRRVASSLDRTFIDLDHEVERVAGVRVTDIFELEGEVGFRIREAEALARLVETPAPLVIATGGGVVETDTNLLVLMERCVVVWLRASVATLAGRVGSGQGRPLLQGTEAPAAVLRRLSERRHPRYDQIADVVVDTDGLNAAQVADEVLAGLRAQVTS